MTPVEQQELAHAVERIDARFDRFEEDARSFRESVSRDVATIKADIDKIKGMARLAAWFVGAFGGIMALLTVVVMAVTRQQ